jgi:hypothetical protein
MPAPDGPSILTSPPISLPDPADKERVVLPPSPPPYRTPGVPATERSPRTTPRVASFDAARTPFVAAAAAPEPAVGDRAGEHLAMRRGRYGAWGHVVIAYLFESALLGAVLADGLRYLFHSTTHSGIPTAIGMLTGAVLVSFVFRDRWRCTEAHASRYCSGLLNLSLLYVPLIALVYANVRGLAKARARLSRA